MARFLITGARAPVALELVRNLARHGHYIVVADSLRYPAAKNSRYIKKYVIISEPVTQLNMFQKDLIRCIKSEKIDYLLPCCEEIFYISFLKDILSEFCNVICDRFELLSKLHSKYSIMGLAVNCGITLPYTEKIDMACLQAGEIIFNNKIIKKEFSRFGLDVLLNPDKSNINDFVGCSTGSSVLQQKISGQEYCTYSIVYKGELKLHSCYQPLYRMGKAAGFYFKPVIHGKIKSFVKTFAMKHKYTGQIGFDVIDDGSEIFLIECNPRATSGIHLVADEDLAACFLGQVGQTRFICDKPAMIGLAMKLIALPHACVTFRLRQWWRDYFCAQDVMNANGDRSFVFYSLVSLLELMCKAIRQKSSLRAASTHDIEWDGRPL